jgi:hypothetical protein
MWKAKSDVKKSAVCHFHSLNVQGGSNMTGTIAYCLHTNQSRSYLNHLVPLESKAQRIPHEILGSTDLLAKKFRLKICLSST